jgi:integrase
LHAPAAIGDRDTATAGQGDAFPAMTAGQQRVRTRSIPYTQLDRLWRRDDVAVREKALWRLLYETAARAQEVLSLNVEDLDLDNKRARVRSSGLCTQRHQFSYTARDRRTRPHPAGAAEGMTPGGLPDARTAYPRSHRRHG